MRHAVVSSTGPCADKKAASEAKACCGVSLYEGESKSWKVSRKTPEALFGEVLLPLLPVPPKVLSVIEPKSSMTGLSYFTRSSLTSPQPCRGQASHGVARVVNRAFALARLPHLPTP
jgi:hypothetical protein